MYVHSLCRALRHRGHEALVFFTDEFRDCRAEALRTREYAYEGIPVFVLERNAAFLRTQDIYTGKDTRVYEAFREYLLRIRPQVMHVHHFIPAQTPGLIDAAHAAGIPVIFTYHTPMVSCGREDMRAFGRVPCRGQVRERRCLACLQTKYGIPRALAWVWSWLPYPAAKCLARAAGAGGSSGPLFTWLQLPWLFRMRCAHVREVFQRADHFVAVCEWVREALRCNGVPDERITLSRQGIEAPALPPRKTKEKGSVLRVGYIGRIDEVKGIHVLLEAVRRVKKEVPLTVHIYGTVQGPKQRQYERKLRARYGRDPRVFWQGELPASRRFETMSSFDVLAVPSVWLETGPLVVMEAWACRVPVVGSRQGGIAELVQEGKGGLLVAPGDARSLADALCRLAEDEGLRMSLTDSIPAVRTVDAVAAEMEGLYRRVAHQAHP